MTTPATQSPSDVVVPSGQPPEATRDAAPSRRRNVRPTVPSTRASRSWVAVLPGLAVVAIGLVFVVQNLRDARVSFFTATGTIPLAVALIAAFALGALAVLLLGSIRIFQLRKVIRRSASPTEH
jgi:uncharacterized integral membrane protein